MRRAAEGEENAGVLPGGAALVDCLGLKGRTAQARGVVRLGLWGGAEGVKVDLGGEESVSYSSGARRGAWPSRPGDGVTAADCQGSLEDS